MGELKLEATENFLPEKRTLPALRAAARLCRGCPLYLNATQTVFGAGNVSANIMLVGEQPGDEEDQAGEPFVGPAGKLLDQALERAGLDRNRVYVTNVVKHFHHEVRGAERLHKRPPAGAIKACMPWILSELDLVRPGVLVLLGATAARSLLGDKFRVSRERGKTIDSGLAPIVLATLHPSAILRSPNPVGRAAALETLVEDLTLAARHSASKKLQRE
jgi:uracil-DNA glycosylase family protein